MNVPVIVSAVRTAIGTARKGSLARTRPEALAQVVLEAVLARSAVAPEVAQDWRIRPGTESGRQTALLSSERCYSVAPEALVRFG